jgi:tRNA A-37 threonylcarbamoyl transferase component Bud32/outer membrane protein assembly factor BamB
MIASYRLLGVLGSGGMARVYLATSLTGRRLAIKVIRADLAENPLIRHRFAHEVAALRKVNPLFTAPIVDADTDAAEPWLATTFIDGPSLDDWVAEQGPLSPAAVLTLAAGLAEALASIHEGGLVHRDLKPGNVLLDDGGPHIIDFGVALLDNATRLTVSLVGTPAYMAPERLRGEDGTPEADIFSLGATLAFAATGRGLVGQGTVYAQVMQIAEGRIDLSGVPAPVRTLIAWCVSRRPKDRPSAAELTRLLSESGVQMAGPGWYRDLSGEPASPVPPLSGRLSRPGVRVWRRRAVILGGAAVVASAAGLGITAALSRGQASAGGPTTAPRTGPGSVRWQVRSGVRPGNGTSPRPGERIIVYPDGRVVTVGPSDVHALDTVGTTVWHLPASTGPVGTWRWGDGVLVNDGQQLTLFDVASGAKRFSVTVPETVRAAATLDDRAILDIGSGMLAVDTAGGKLWQQPPRRGTGGPRDGVAVTVDAGHLLIQERYGGTVFVTLADPGTGLAVWTVSYDVPPPPLPPSGPPGDDGGPPPDGDGPPPDGNRPPPPPPELRDRLQARFAGDLVALQTGQHLRISRLADGQGSWQQPFDRPVSDVAVAGGRVIVAADQVTAHDLTTGAQQWNHQLRGAQLAVTPGGAVVAASNTQLALLDPGSAVHWQVPLPPAMAVTMPDGLTTDGNTAFLTVRDPRSGPTTAPDVTALALQ